MAIVKSWSGDNAPLGAVGASTAGDGDNAFTHIQGAALEVVAGGVRPRRLKLPDTASFKRVGWWPLATAPLSSYAVRWYMSFGAYPDSPEVYVANGLLGGAGMWSVRLTSTGNLRIRDDQAATVRWTSNLPLETDTAIRCELVVTGDQMQLKAYNGDSMTVLANGLGTVGAGIDETRFGFSTATASSNFFYDDLAVADTPSEIGAIEPYIEPPTTGVIKQWTGQGLSAGPLSTNSAGVDDDAFTSVTGSVVVANEGARSPRIVLPDTATIKRFGWWPLAATPLTQYAVRTYVTIGAFSSTEVYLFNGLLAGGDGWSLRMSTSGRVRLRDDTTASYPWSGSVTLPLNKALRIEVVANSVTTSVAVYNGDTMTVIDSGAASISRSIDEVRFGFSSSNVSTALTYDDLAVANHAVLIGPAAPPPEEYTHFRYDGTTWVPQVVDLL